MEFWARWAHRALWHASLWHMHEVRHFEYKKEETCTYDNKLMKNNLDNGCSLIIDQGTVPSNSTTFSQ
jgi:hypothetical protein